MRLIVPKYGRALKKPCKRRLSIFTASICWEVETSACAWKGCPPQSLLPEMGIGTEEAGVREKISESTCALLPTHPSDVAVVLASSEGKSGPNPNLNAQTHWQAQVSHSPVGFASPPAPWATIRGDRRSLTEG